MRTFKKPPSLQARLRANLAALRFMASCSPKNRTPIQGDVAPKRKKESA